MSLPRQMKQWNTAQNGVSNLNQSTASVSSPGIREVLVKIQTVALNYRDTEVCMGLYNHHKSVEPAAAIVPCSDMCGTVVGIGGQEREDKPMWKIGDRVLSIFNQTHLTGQVTAKEMASGLGLPLPGVLCEYRVFPEYGLIKAPEYLSDEEACTLPIAGVTAWMALNGMRQIGKPGLGNEKVLIQGTGGVSVSGLLFAKASGMEVIITSSSDEKLQRAKSLGADHLINYRNTPQWDRAVLSLTSEHGVDIIFENGGAETLPLSFECIAFGGLIDCIGYLSGKMDASAEPSMHTNVLALKRNVTLKGILNGPKDRFEEMIEFMSERKVRMVVDKVFSFAEANEGLEYLFKGSHFGKVVIRVS